MITRTSSLTSAAGMEAGRSRSQDNVCYAWPNSWPACCVSLHATPVQPHKLLNDHPAHCTNTPCSFFAFAGNHATLANFNATLHVRNYNCQPF